MSEVAPEVLAERVEHVIQELARMNERSSVRAKAIIDRLDIANGRVSTNERTISGHLRDHVEADRIAEIRASVLFTKGAGVKLLAIVTAGATLAGVVITSVLKVIES